MKRSERINLYKELYLLEIDNKAKIDARLNLPLAIALGLISLLAYMLQNIPTFEWEFNHFFFWIPFSLSVGFLVYAFLSFKESWFGQTDQLMPTARSIKEYYEKLECHYSDDKNKKELVEQHFRDFLENSYSAYATTNAVNNDYRSYNLYKTIRGIAAALIFAFLALLPFHLISYFNNHKNSAEVISNDQTKESAAATAGTKKCEGPSSTEEPTTTTKKTISDVKVN